MKYLFNIMLFAWFFVSYTTMSAETLRISATDSGVQGGWNATPGSNISLDGRYVSFRSYRSFDASDPNGFTQIYVYDRDTDTFELVSKNGAGVKGNGLSQGSSISGDGRYVAFRTRASNLDAADIDSFWDIYVYDRDADTLELVSKNTAGVKGNGDSYFASMSLDGRYVVFRANSTNLDAADTDDTPDIFIYDRNADTLELVSKNAAGIKGNGFSSYPSINGDGRYVAFYTQSSNLGAGDTDHTPDVFVYDRDTDTLDLVSKNTAGVKGNSASLHPSISVDGRYVVFRTSSTNLDAADTDDITDIYVYDRDTDTLELVSKNAAGVKGNAMSAGAFVSANGRYVAFYTESTNLDASDSDEFADVYVHDRDAGVLELVSQSTAGEKGNNHSFHPSVAPVGVISFSSHADNLVLGDTGPGDVFVRVLDSAQDADNDGDGVANADDTCPFTGDEVVDPASGCSIAQYCPCEGPEDLTLWRTHGMFVSCTANTSESFVEQGLITEAEKDAIVSSAAQSECGVKENGNK